MRLLSFAFIVAIGGLSLATFLTSATFQASASMPTPVTQMITLAAAHI